MGRRKPLHVQRKRPRDAEQGSGSRDEAKEANVAMRLLEDIGGGGHQDASGWEPLANNGKKQKRRRVSYEDPILRVLERVLSSSAMEVAPLRLTFRDAWTAQYRQEALWLEWRVPQQQVNAAFFKAIAAYEERMIASGKIAESSERVTIGLELHGPARRVTLCADDSGDNDDSRLPTALLLYDLFPETHALWSPHLVNLVHNELLVMEVVRLRDGGRQNDIIKEDGGDSFMWRVGVAWRPYRDQVMHNHPHVTLPVRNASYHRSMHNMMLWALRNARRAQQQQCEYRYWKEIDVLYDQYVGRIHNREDQQRPDNDDSDALQSVSFDIHDIYARIDTQQQLARNTSNFEEASARHESGTSLLPSLRPYQKAAVSWMLSRERPTAGSASDTHQMSLLVQFLGFESSTGGALAYDPFCAHFYASSGDWAYGENDEALPANAKFELSSVRGGILADEMGLGKTVEVITLVLSNPWPEDRPVLQSTHTMPHQDSESDDESMARDCICGFNFNDGEGRGWVQCDFCKTWHHQLCTGYNEGAALFTSQASSKGSSIHGDHDVFAPGSFMCFHCQTVEKPEFSCKTTLIVSPEAIHDQWETELKRHVKPGVLKLLRYPGVKALRSRLASLRGPSADWQILANAGLYLASYDVVLTTYEALSSDLYHLPTDVMHERRSSTRQKRKKYAFVASPLIFLKFWRVCMDEAQVGVENAQLQAALTVAKIKAEMKWVVTGTPFSTQVGDLFGCFKFLRLAPYDDEHVGRSFFREAVEKCFSKGAIERVLDILLWDGSRNDQDRRAGGGLLWRTSKKDVLSQLNLPEQVTELIWCRFSDVERHFYDEQEKLIITKVKEYQRQSQRAASIDGAAPADVTEKIWQDLLVLRQICCHPQVGSTLSAMFSLRGGRNGAAANGDVGGRNGGVLSMDEFLQELILKCKRECEEGQRKYVAAQNGLASLHVIRFESAAAIVKYLSCIQVIRGNWDLFRADLLPRLHLLENLARCVRTIFNIVMSEENGSSDGENATDGDAAEPRGAMTDASASRVELSVLETEVADISSNPKENSLLPDLPALAQAITVVSSGDVTMRETADVESIACECEVLDVCASKIKQFYLYQVEASHSVALNSFQTVTKAVNDDALPKLARSVSKRRALCSSSLWWVAALSTLETKAPEQVVLFADRLRARLLAFGTKWAQRFCNQFTTIAGFQMVFLNELEELFKKRSLLYEKLLRMSSKPPTKKDVELSGNCRKCRDARDGPVCDHCKLYKELEAFRLHFLGIDAASGSSDNVVGFSLSSTRRGQGNAGGGIFDEGDENEGDTAASVAANMSSLLLEVFREIASSTRAVVREMSDGRDAPLSIQEGLREELEFWTQVQREWTAAKKLFQVQHQRLGALDELEMATMQIRVRLEGEEVKTAAEKLYKLQEHEVETKFAAFESERLLGELEMREKLSRLRFLLQLEQQREPKPSENGDSDELMMADADGERATSQQPEPKQKRSSSSCAVCLEKMENERVMLPCAHSFCKSCMKTLSQQHKATGTLRCPTCRRVCSVAKVVVVYEESKSSPISQSKKRGSFTVRPVADAHIQLTRGGGYGSKIDAILRRVLALAQQDAQVKCLLFTQWPEMTSIVTAQLMRNGIMCFTYTTKKGFPRVLQQFKMHADPCVLALPFKVGANGLNLVEATEVLLVEPLLNTSIEAQAINRVHRIGQTRQTRVHRLVVDNSVEERIYWLGQKKRRGSGSRGSKETENEAKQEEEKEDNETEADDDEDVVAERAPTKKEKEHLTLNDLHVLLDGKLASTASADGDDREGDDERHPFWQEQVVLNGKCLSRHQAKLFVERRHAAECRAKGQQADEEPQTHLFDQEVNLVVAHELVGLQHATALEQSQAISTELLAFHRARLHEELELWRSAAAVA